MPKILIVGTEEYEFPIVGENAGYGEQVTAWAEAVSTALLTVQARNDIPMTTAPIVNGALVATPIPAFSFDTTEVIAINGEYIVKRTTDVPANNLVENGVIQGNFDGSQWVITHRSTGDAQISFDITSAGQVTYTSTSLTGTNYSGEILFKAKVFNQSEE